jgi:hypothetical protein
VWTWLGRCGLEHGKAYKDEVIEGGKYEVVKEALRKPPLKFSIILGKDFVQMIAKVSSVSWFLESMPFYILRFRG